MNRPYIVTIQVRNSDKGKMDRAEIILPIRQGGSATEIGKAIVAALDEQPVPQVTAVSEHERLVELQNKAVPDAPAASAPAAKPAAPAALSPLATPSAPASAPVKP